MRAEGTPIKPAARRRTVCRYCYTRTEPARTPPPPGKCTLLPHTLNTRSRARMRTQKHRRNAAPSRRCCASRPRLSTQPPPHTHPPPTHTHEHSRSLPRWMSVSLLSRVQAWPRHGSSGGKRVGVGSTTSAWVDDPDHQTQDKTGEGPLGARSIPEPTRTNEHGAWWRTQTEAEPRGYLREEEGLAGDCRYLGLAASRRHTAHIEDQRGRLGGGPWHAWAWPAAGPCMLHHAPTTTNTCRTNNHNN